MLLKADLDRWTERILDFGTSDPLPSEPGHRFQGETDRTLWRPEGGVLRFFPSNLEKLLKEAVPPTPTKDNPFLIHASGFVDDALDDTHRPQPLPSNAWIHPASGIPEGEFTVETKYGSITLSVRHDDRIRKDVLRAPVEAIPEIIQLLPDGFAAHTGAPILDGIPCRFIVDSQ